MSTGIKPVKELVAEANKVITTLSIDEGSGSAGCRRRRHLGHPRRTGAVARWHGSGRPPYAARNARVLGRSREPLSQGRFRFRQDINPVLRIGLALGARH